MAEITAFIVDDEEQIRSSVVQLLDLSEIRSQAFESADLALQQLTRDSAAIVVSDIRMPGIDGMELLKRVNKIDPHLPVILITGHGDVATAVEAMQHGAYDFIEKPFDPENLIAKIQRAAKSRSLALDNRILRSALSNPERLKHVFVGSSPAMESLRSEILDFAQSDDHILISGESGSGRSLAARSIHAASPMAKFPLRTIHCGAYEEAELEAHIFDDKTSAPFQSPSRNVLILDEINNLSEKLQARLVAELDNYDEEPHLRVIAIQTTTEAGQLIDSLKYRLEGKHLNIAPLRERGADILSIFTKYYEHFAQDYGIEPKQIDANHAAILMSTNWPGNVRQLVKLAERLAMNEGDVDLENALRQEIGLVDGVAIESSANLKTQVDAFEEMLIRNSLARNNGSIAAVLDELALPRRTLNEKMARYGLSRADFVS